MSFPRIALGSWAFSFGPFQSDPWSFDRVLEFASDAGYDGVEINGFRPHPHPLDYDTPAKCQALMDRLAAHGLGVSGYAPDFTSAPPAAVEASQYLGVLDPCLRFCDRCGIDTLRVDTVSPPEALAFDEYEKRFERLVTTWRASAERAALSGIRIVWEFEPGFWLNKPSEVLRLVQEVAHPGFSLLFDTSHAYMGAVVGARHAGTRELLPGGVAEYAGLLADHIGHLHLIDSDGTLHDDETSTHAAFGEGKVDSVEVLTAIKPVVAAMPWWCVDFCFNPATPTAGREAVPVVRGLQGKVLS
jgi:sugar phosphate isomerase/epimerase